MISINSNDNVINVADAYQPGDDVVTSRTVCCYWRTYVSLTCRSKQAYSYIQLGSGNSRHHDGLLRDDGLYHVHS